MAQSYAARPEVARLLDELRLQIQRLSPAAIEAIGGVRSPDRGEAWVLADRSLTGSGRRADWEQATAAMIGTNFADLPSSVRHSAYDMALVIIVRDQLAAAALRPLAAAWRVGGPEHVSLVEHMGLWP